MKEIYVINSLEMPSKVADNGMAYKIPKGIDSDKFYSLVKEFSDLVKVKGLTVRQAQALFYVCAEYVLDQKFV